LQELEGVQKSLAEQLSEDKLGRRSIEDLIDHQRSLEEERELKAEIETVRPCGSKPPVLAQRALWEHGSRTGTVCLAPTWHSLVKQELIASSPLQCHGDLHTSPEGMLLLCVDETMRIIVPLGPRNVECGDGESWGYDCNCAHNFHIASCMIVCQQNGTMVRTW